MVVHEDDCLPPRHRRHCIWRPARVLLPSATRCAEACESTSSARKSHAAKARIQPQRQRLDLEFVVPEFRLLLKNFTLRLEQTGTTAGAPLEKNSSLLDGEIKPAPRNESEGSKPLRSATVRDDRPKPFTENTRQGGMWMRNPVLNSAWGFQPPDYDGPSYQAPIKNGDFLTPLERSRFRIPAGKYEPLRPIRDPINK